MTCTAFIALDIGVGVGNPLSVSQGSSGKCMVKIVVTERYVKGLSVSVPVTVYNLFAHA